MINSENNNQADQVLLSDLVENILMYSDNPGACARYITDRIRELIGVRIVALIEHVPGQSGVEYQLMSICPSRKEADWNQPEIQKFVPFACKCETPRLFDPMTDPEAVSLSAIDKGKAFVVPLLAGSQKVGVIVLIGMMDSLGAKEILATLARISGVIALIMRNSLLYRNMENLVETRTLELAERERMQRLALHVGHIGAFELDPESRQGTWTPELAVIWGMPNNFTGDFAAFCWAHVHPEDLAQTKQNFAQILQSGKESEMEFRIIRPDGVLRWIRWRGQANRDSAPGSLRVFVVNMDITERKQAEGKLKKNEAFIRNILESVGEGFIVVDREYRIQSVNRAFCDFVKMPAAEIVGRHCYEVSHYTDKPCFETGEQCAVRQMFETSVPQFVSHVHTTRTGGKQYVEIRAYPITDAAGAVVSAIETISDVTERKVIEDQLRQAQKMEAIGHLAGGIAHDFNNMLTAIIGYGSLLNTKLEKDSELRPFVDQILSSAGKSANLTRQLLAFSRKQEIAPKETDLNELVKGTEKLLLRLIGEDIELKTQLAEKTLTAMIDPGQIEQVLMNLSTNARDAMPEGGLLSICTDTVELDTRYVKGHDMKKPGMYALISVTDTGGGIDEKTQQKIFEPFFTTKELGKGTGLGLSIVYGIIKQHDGNITVYSEPGKGTTFRIYLPLIETMIEEAKVSESSIPHGGTETILIAEDNEEVRVLSKKVLEEFGYKVIDAVDGEDAVNKFKEYKDSVSLVMVDVIMPKKSGKEAIDVIKKTRPDVKVLFTSGYTSEIISRKGILEEGMDFISKPVAPQTLLAKIREILDKA
ncbi:MAG: PAS domain S-box protein [Nitrospirae bacterium]|nr:PAS domain S-box protein [Nitrospirota bacterium]